MLYSLPTGERIVSALLHAGRTVIFRPHPFSYDFDDDASDDRPDSRHAGGRRPPDRPAHLWGPPRRPSSGILDCINASDAMVSDVSSVVSDYLFSGKPFAMIAVPAEPDAFVAEFPVARASYVVRGDLADLEPAAGPDARRRPAGRRAARGSAPTISATFRPRVTPRRSSTRSRQVQRQVADGHQRGPRRQGGRGDERGAGSVEAGDEAASRTVRGGAGRATCSCATPAWTLAGTRAGGLGRAGRRSAHRLAAVLAVPACWPPSGRFGRARQPGPVVAAADRGDTTRAVLAIGLLVRTGRRGDLAYAPLWLSSW